MFTQISRISARASRRRRIRAVVSGTATRPRLAARRSLAHISAQLIDDTTGTTLAAATDKGMTGTRIEIAKQVGVKLAEAAKAKKITSAVYDRAGYLYHGRVAALAEGAREGGLTL